MPGEELAAAMEQNAIDRAGRRRGVEVRPAAILRLLAETSRRNVAMTELVEGMLEAFGARPPPDHETSHMRRHKTSTKRLMAYAVMLYEAACIGEVVLQLTLNERTNTALTPDDLHAFIMGGTHEERRARIDTALLMYCHCEKAMAHAYGRPSVTSAGVSLPDPTLVARIANLLVHGERPSEGDDLDVHDCVLTVSDLTNKVVAPRLMSIRLGDAQGLLAVPEKRDVILRALWNPTCVDSIRSFFFTSSTNANAGTAEDRVPAEARRFLVTVIGGDAQGSSRWRCASRAECAMRLANFECATRLCTVAEWAEMRRLRMLNDDADSESEYCGECEEEEGEDDEDDEDEGDEEEEGDDGGADTSESEESFHADVDSDDSDGGSELPLSSNDSDSADSTDANGSDSGSGSDSDSEVATPRPKRKRR